MKILHLDIETSPCVAYVWGLRDKFIPVDRLAEPGYTLCWAAKWHGEKGVMFSSVHEDGEEGMLEKVHALLDEADAVVHYYGSGFDIPTLNREFVLNGMAPPAPYKQIDLYRTVRKNFRFVSNKLDFVAQQLGLGCKVKHKGFSLWTGCMEGDEKSWKEMKRYNKQDVVLLEPLYETLLPWITGHPNPALYSESKHDISCVNCGSTDLSSRGHAYTNVGKYRRYQCNDCGKWNRGRTTVIEKDYGKLVLTGVSP